MQRKYVWRATQVRNLIDSIYVRVFTDRIEISNPGSFIGGVTPNNILTHPPVRRNPLLAEILQHIGAVNRGGLGVDRMYRRLLSYGKLPPEYPEITGAVQVIIRNGAFDTIGEKEKYTRIKGLSEEQKLQLLKNHLKTNERITNEEARVICGINRYQAARLLKKLVLEGLLIPRGTGRSAHYDINRSFK